ncbi:hypothetical protein N331_05668, partial [Merops nubicus]
DFDVWRCLRAFNGKLGSALPKVAVAGVQHHSVTPFPGSYTTIAGGGGTAASTIPLPDVHFKRPRHAPAQEEGADFVVIVAPKQQPTKRRGFRDPEH